MTAPFPYRLLAVASLLATAPRAEVDVFGSVIMHPSRSPALEWNSLHWAQGGKRTLTGIDPVDPTGWSRMRGDTQLKEVDGAGILRMGGVQPRIYFMAAAGKPLFFRDVEVTGWFRRIGTDGATNGGFMVGARSHPEGHTEADHCNASTYYAGIRYPGTWILDKELDHPNDSPGKTGRLFPGSRPMPSDRWLGFKYLAYNLPDGESVKLEIFADTVSDGNPKNGGAWFKMADIIDNGNWTAPPGDCGYPGNTVVTQGGGVVFFRNTGAAEANYKMVTIREIAPGTASAFQGPAPAPRNPWYGGPWVDLLGREPAGRPSAPGLLPLPFP